jgi:hypothetical protein
MGSYGHARSIKKAAERTPSWKPHCKASKGEQPTVALVAYACDVRHPPCCCCIGAPIKIFFVDEVLAIAESASTASIADVEVVVWSGGDHCMYNHMSEKHTLIADWFWEKIR